MSALPALARSPRRLTVGGCLLAALALAAIIGPWFAADPSAIVDARELALLPPGGSRYILTRADGTALAASGVHRDGATWVLSRTAGEERVPAADFVRVSKRRFWLGTDTVGRDVLARLLSGARVSLGVGGTALLLALLVGVSVGLAAGWRGGAFDAVLMRVVDALLAIPMHFLLLFLAAVFRPSLAALVAVLGFSSWMGVARLVRAQVLSLKGREFILAARAIGASPWRIALVHLLPNSLTPIAQDGALRLGDLILVEASLSFLGLGVQPPVPSWGNMVAEGQDVLATGWWLALLPTALVALTVIAAALAADGLQELAGREERVA